MLGTGIDEVKAVLVETESAMDTFLVARSGSAWSAIRTPIVHELNDDPGCPSIERPIRVVSVTVESRHGHRRERGRSLLVEQQPKRATSRLPMRARARLAPPAARPP